MNRNLQARELANNNPVMYVRDTQVEIYYKNKPGIQPVAGPLHLS